MSQSDTVFLAYSRDVNQFIASALFHTLEARGYDVFMDTRRPRPAPDSIIHHQIQIRTHFVLIFSLPSVKTRFGHQLLNQMIDDAYTAKSNIVLVLAYGFGAHIRSWMRLNTLTNFDKRRIIRCNHQNIQKTADVIVSRLKNPQTKISTSPISAEDAAIVADTLNRARSQPFPTEKHLQAEYYLNRGAYIEHLAVLRNKPLSAGYLAAYSKAIEAYPQYASAYYWRAIARLGKLGDENSRGYLLEDITSAIQFDPENDAYYSFRAMYRKQDEQGAIDDYTKAIRINPDNVQSYRRRAAIYYQLQDTVSALADYNAALQLEPDNPDLYFGRGMIFRSQQATEKAIADLRKCLLLIGKREWPVKVYATKFLNELLQQDT